MTITRFFYKAAAALALSSLALVPLASQAQARPGVDSSGVQILLGNPQLDCSLPAMATICAQMRRAAETSSSGGLGNRIGTFAVSSHQRGYVKSKVCFMGADGSDDNGSRRLVEPIAGPDASGVFTWSIWAKGSQAFTQANCYFNGEAGIFSHPAFNNTENIATGGDLKIISKIVYPKKGVDCVTTYGWGFDYNEGMIVVPTTTCASYIDDLTKPSYTVYGEQSRDRQLDPITGAFATIATNEPAFWTEYICKLSTWDSANRLNAAWYAAYTVPSSPCYVSPNGIFE